MGLIRKLLGRDNAGREHGSNPDESTETCCAGQGSGEVKGQGFTFEPFAKFFGEEAPGFVPDDSIDSLIAQLGGRSFGKGLFTVFDPGEKAKWEGIVLECLVSQCDLSEDFSFELFGRNWNGYCYGVETSCDDPTILAFDVDAVEVNSLDSTLGDFLNKRIPSNCNGCLASGSYEKWLETHRALSRGECVGLVKPLFLGGKDDFDNMEVIDMEVHWEMTSQIWQAVRDLPPGTPIGSIRFE